ncbi:sulfotransferase 1C2 isoform X1 [Amia ocellicauda]|uniref:sulfotransferase 1C2 isoform X1 n=1 Tax=Amia ocellicauda TaxID=2972642 RepID=UPI003464CDF5
MAEEMSYSAAIEEAGQVMCRFPLKHVDGVPLMNLIVDRWDEIAAFTPDPSDMLIATYPKAGTTWTQEIVDLIIHEGDAEACRRAPTFVRMPFMEIVSPRPIPSGGIGKENCRPPLGAWEGLTTYKQGLDLLNTMDPPRVIKTHLPFKLVPKGFWENKCKVIYVARNAKDNLVSYYHFDRMNKTQPEPGPWEGYIQKFIRGELAWGSWYDHVKGFWVERERRNILYLFYEDMKENPRREVVRIMEYMGRALPDDVIDRIVELTSFQVMKENPMTNYTTLPKSVLDQSVSRFMRKGEVGNWASHFSPSQSREFDEDYEHQMGGAGIPFRTQL